MATFTARTFRRDPGLVTRMYFTMFLLGLLYAGFVLVMMALGVNLIAIGAIVGVLALVQFMLSDRLIIWSTGAKVVNREQEPELHAMVERLAQRAGMPMPQVAIMRNSVPNAFATGRSPKKALVAVTTGIRERLSDRELEAVIGHELTHVRNRDMLVLAIASFFVMLTSFLMQMFFFSMLFGGMGGMGGNRRDNNAGAIMMIYMVTFLVYFIGQLLVLALTRYREYGADHGGAELTGDPGALASALEKITGSLGRIPEKDMRQVQTASAFMFAPLALRGGGMSLFSTHPPVQERIRRLRELERQMRFGF